MHKYALKEKSPIVVETNQENDMTCEKQETIINLP